MNQLMDSPLICGTEDAGLAHHLLDMIGFWTSRACATILWGFNTVPEMADHGHQHAQNVFEILSELLGAHKQKLNDGEIFCIVCAAWLHDIGLKGDGKTKESKAVRKIHGKLTASLLRRNWTKLRFNSIHEAIETSEKN